MKRFKYLILVFALLLLIPLGVDAKGKDKVNIYFFRGDGCPHCEEAEEFFANIKKDYGKYYNLVGYEVWYNENNSKLLEEVASKLGTEASGVPFIVIGEKYYSGFAESMQEEIKTAIEEIYKADSRTDILKKVSKDVLAKSTSDADNGTGSSNDAVSLIIILVVVCLIILLIIYTRKKVNIKSGREEFRDGVKEIKDEVKEKEEEFKEEIEDKKEEIKEKIEKKKEEIKEDVKEVKEKVEDKKEEIEVLDLEEKPKVEKKPAKKTTTNKKAPTTRKTAKKAVAANKSSSKKNTPKKKSTSKKKKSTKKTSKKK